MKTISIKILKIITNIILIISVLLFGFTVYNRIIGKELSIFGYSFSLVLTSSMDGVEEPVIKKGDFIITKKISIDDVKVGDVVLYRTKLQSNLDMGIERIIHKVIAVNTDEENNIYFTTKGTANATADEENVTDVVGIYLTKSTFLGKVFNFLSSPVNLIFMLIVASLLGFAVKQIKNIKKEIDTNKTK